MIPKEICKCGALYADDCQCPADQVASVPYLKDFLRREAEIFDLADSRGWSRRRARRYLERRRGRA